MSMDTAVKQLQRIQSRWEIERRVLLLKWGESAREWVQERGNLLAARAQLEALFDDERAAFVEEIKRLSQEKIDARNEIAVRSAQLEAAELRIEQLQLGGWAGSAGGVGAAGVGSLKLPPSLAAGSGSLPVSPALLTPLQSVPLSPHRQQQPAGEGAKASASAAAAASVSSVAVDDAEAGQEGFVVAFHEGEGGEEKSDGAAAARAGDVEGSPEIKSHSLPAALLASGPGTGMRAGAGTGAAFSVGEPSLTQTIRAQLGLIAERNQLGAGAAGSAAAAAAADPGVAPVHGAGLVLGLGLGLGGLQSHGHGHGHGVEGSVSLEGVVPGAAAGAGAGVGAGEADAALRAARETIALKLQVSRLREEAAVKQRELGALQHEHAAFRSEYERTRTRLLAVQGDLEARAKELAAVRTEAASAQAKARETTQSLTAENTQLRADLKQVKAQLETLLGFSEAKEAECARLRGENAKQAAEVKDLTGKVGSLLGYSGLKDRELRELRAEMDRQRDAWALERKQVMQQAFSEGQTTGSLAALGKR